MNSKKQTSASVAAEIERIKTANISRNDKIVQLRSEITADNAKIKELEKLHESLKQAELQGRITKLWFHQKKLTEEQVMKYLALCEQVGDDIDNYDVGTIASKITGTSGSSKKTKLAPIIEPVEVPDSPEESQEE